VLQESAAAIAAWRARRWDECERAWRAILALHPDDGIARLYLERLAEARLASPDSWKDAVELEKL
jgi:hypothetical protein